MAAKKLVLPLVVILALVPIRLLAEDEPFIYALGGVFFHVSDYVYTLLMEPDSGPLRATVARVRELDQPWYRVTVGGGG